MQVFVVGMHRSGTSAVTRLLNMMGLYFGPEGIDTGFNQENPKGFWERKDFRALNDRTLSAGGGSWYRLTRFSLDRIDSAERKDIETKASQLIMELDHNRPWVVKEPRFCVLLDIYRPALDMPVAVMTLRNPIEIAMSLKTRNDFPLPFGIALWERYTRSAFQQTKGMPRLLVKHADLMRDPVATVEKLYQQLQGLNVGPIRMPKEQEITSFIEPALHRQKAEEKDMLEMLNQDQLDLFNGIRDGSLLTADDTGPLSEIASFVLEADETSRLLNNQIAALQKENSSLSNREESLAKERNQLKETLESERKAARGLAIEQQERAEHLGEAAAGKLLDILREDLEPLIKGPVEIKRQAQQLVEFREWVETQGNWQNYFTQILEGLNQVRSEFVELSRKSRDKSPAIEDQPGWLTSVGSLLDACTRNMESMRSDTPQWHVIIDMLKGNQTKIDFLQELFADSSPDDMLLSLRGMLSKHEQLQQELSEVTTTVQQNLDKGQLLSAQQLEAQAEKLMSQMRCQQDTLATLESRINDVKHFVSDEQKERHSRLERKLEHIGEGVTEQRNLYRELGQTQATNEMLRSQLEEKQSAILEMKGQLQTLQQDSLALRERENQLAAANEHATHLSEELNALEDSRSSLSKDLDHLKAEHLELAAKYEQVKSDRNRIKEERNLMTKQRNDERAQVKKLSEDRSHLKRKVERTTTDLRNSQARIEVLERNLRERSQEVTKLADQLADATYQFQNMEPKFRQLKARYDDIKASKLWAFGLFVNRVRSAVGMRNADAPSVDPGYLPSRSELKASVIKEKPPLAVIVPIYNAYEELQRCLDSLVKFVPQEHQVILINDCSSDTRIADLIAQYANRNANFLAERNPQNLGFTKTVNRGLRIAEGKDVVILNSDTIVTPEWLSGLRECAYSTPGVATVTPLSNAAGAFSVPENNTVNSIPDGFTLDEWASFIRSNSLQLRPRVPTGNGFCMFIRREAIDSVGALDEERFPRGYGEENDFCMRAGKAGFVHIIDDATFIFHARNASFGPERENLIKQGRAMIDKLHPEYTGEVRKWLKNDPVDKFRKKLRQQLKSQPSVAAAVASVPAKSVVSTAPKSSQSYILYILHAGGGGTKLTSEDLFKKVSEFKPALMLRTHLKNWELLKAEDGKMTALDTFTFPNDWLIDQPLQQDRVDVIVDLLESYNIELIHMRHLLANGPELIDLFKKRNLPVVFSFHDFYAVCPTIQLIDNTTKHCAGDCNANQASAISLKSKDCTLTKSWYRRPVALKHKYVHTWRERLADPLEACDAWVTTSKSTRDLIVKYFPRLDRPNFEIIEHGRNFDAYKKAAVTPPEDGPARVVIFGALGPSKGVELISEVMKMNHRDGSPFEFHILGNKIPSFKPEKFGGIYHGSYDNRHLPNLLADIKPSFSVIASIWPETFCHTLTESWACGIPVFGCDIGAVKDRIETHGGGWLCDYLSPATWYAQMRNALSDRKDFQRKLEDIDNMDFKTVVKMAKQYLDLYDRVKVPARASSLV